MWEVSGTRRERRSRRCGWQRGRGGHWVRSLARELVSILRDRKADPPEIGLTRCFVLDQKRPGREEEVRAS